MPRTARASAANLCYHVLNRGNNRASVFHKDCDFDAFVDLLAEAKLRNPIRILAYCVLPNHFHLALWPLGDGDLGRWMHSMRSAERTVRYGTDPWVLKTATTLDLESALWARGNPRLTSDRASDA